MRIYQDLPVKSCGGEKNNAIIINNIVKGRKNKSSLVASVRGPAAHSDTGPVERSVRESRS